MENVRMSPPLSRRLFLSGAAIAGLSPPGVAQAANHYANNSQAAVYGAAPFETHHLLPGDGLDLARVDLGVPATQVVALTIDDGPDGHELALAEHLAAAGAKATYFPIGQKLRRHPEIVRDLHAAGHAIGCHSYSHPMMTGQTNEERDREFQQSRAAFDDAGLPPPLWFRPPYGDWNYEVARRARAHGLHTVTWTVDSRDWKLTKPATVVARVVEHLDAGAVILLHGTRSATVEALPDILAEGRNRGLRFVTLDQWYGAMATAAGV